MQFLKRSSQHVNKGNKPRRARIWLDRVRPHAHSSWIIAARNVLFRPFSEIDYLTLYWCTLLVLLTSPELMSDIRIVLMAVAATAVAVRMLTRHVFGEETKRLIAFAYYGLLSALSVVSLIGQLETKHWDGSYAHQFNIVFTSVLLAVFALRFIVTSVIFRTGKRKYERLVTERFSDVQYSWKSFLVIMVGGLIILGVLGDYYTAAPTLVLLSYGYTTIVHRLVTGASLAAGPKAA
jgi:hypothetical protein